MLKSRLFRGAAAAALLVTLQVPASANNTPDSESLLDPEIGTAENDQAAAIGTYNTIVVKPDNLDWAQALPTQLALPFHVEAKTTKKKWTVAESYLIVGLAPLTSAGVVGTCCGEMAVEDFSPYSYAVQVPHASSTNHVDKDAWWSVPNVDNSIGVSARNACRNLRKDLSQQGLSHDEIFATDRHTTLSYEFRYVAAVAYTKATGGNDYFWKQTQPTYRNFNIVCQKRDGYEIVRNTDIQPGGNGFAVPFQVSQAALAATVKDHKGHCPAELHLNPTIETNGAGKVTYRFRDHLGAASPVYTAHFDKADIKFLDHVVEVGDTKKNGTLGFAAAQSQPGAFGLKAPGDPDLVQGYYQMEILSPQQKVSNIADYSLKCTIPTVSDDLAAAPDIVNPVIVEGLTATLLKPDLIVEQVQPIPALPNKLFVKVTNIGKAASTPTNLKALRKAGNAMTARGTLVPAIEPGQSQVVQAELGGSLAGATHLHLRIDDPNRIAETDEGNNALQVK